MNPIEALVTGGLGSACSQTTPLLERHELSNASSITKQMELELNDQRRTSPSPQIHMVEIGGVKFKDPKYPKEPLPGKELPPAPKHTPINPAHYKRNGVEVIALTRDLNFNRGNAVKYLVRAGDKDPSKTGEDLRKALWYLVDELYRIGEILTVEDIKPHFNQD